MTALRKRAWAEDNKLRGLGLDSNSSVKFILDKSPFADTETPSNYVFLGRLLPMSEPLNQTALKIEIVLTNEYPAKAPKIRLLTSIHHPNVFSDGTVCLSILNETETWRPAKFLDDVLKDLLEIIDRPDLSIPVDDDVAKEYSERKSDYDRKLLQTVQKAQVPRT